MNTHVHADHVTGSGLMKSLSDPKAKSIISASSGAIADILVNDGDVISCGDQIRLRVMSTPGMKLEK